MGIIKVFLKNGQVMLFPAAGIVGEQRGTLLIGELVEPKDGRHPYTSPHVVFAAGEWSRFEVVQLKD